MYAFLLDKHLAFSNSQEYGSPRSALILFMSHEKGSIPLEF
jgi:hypothetical protein